MTWDDGIEGATLEIAGNPSSPLLTVAGPGTGKTFALMRRIARLLEAGVDPTKILLVTFTRTAANDLQRELDNLKVVGAGRVRKGTLHSFCFSVLNSASVFLQIGRTPRPLLEFEERFLLEDLKNYGEFGNFYQREKRLHAFEAAWAREQNQQPGWASDAVDQDFEAALYKWLRFHRAMLIDELVPETLKYLRNNPECAERRQFEHILVDEYQDLNRAEQNLIDLLSREGNLTVVGDEDQSIYEFRYARPEGIIEFDQVNSDTYSISLTICRRCPTRVVELANNLIRYNERRRTKSLEPRPGNAEGEIHVVQWSNMETEAQGIAKFISKRINAGEFAPGEVLVLCPFRQSGYMIRDSLVSLGQPAHSFFREELLEGDPKTAEKCRAQTALTLLQLVVNPNDRIALRCWLGFDHRELRSKQYQCLEQYCAENNLSVREALEAIRTGELSLSGITGLGDRFELLRKQLDDFAGKSGQEIFDAIFPRGEEWAAPFREIAETFVEGWNLKDILEALVTNITQPELPTTDVSYVRVMSLHKSKGLSAEHVFVVGCVNGIVPKNPREDDLSDEEQDRFREEQRRLFYVSITRPKKTLVLSSFLRIPRRLVRKMGIPVVGGNRDEAETIASPFIQELGPNCPTPVRGEAWLSRR